MLFIDPAAARRVFEATRSSFSPVNSAVPAGNLQSDYNLTEDIHAGYVMARLATDTIRLSGGVRYEATDLSTGAFRQTGPATAPIFTYGQRNQSYRDWLPSAQFDWDITSRLRLRAAFSRTIGRPNYDDVAARETVAIGITANNPDGGVSITSGNPDLRPRRSDNYDLSLEYYVNRDVLFAGALFQKDIADEIITIRNQTNELFDGTVQLVNRIQPVNASASRVRGLELNAVVSRMRFLPGPFDGLGFSANLTLLDPTPPSVALNGGPAQRRLSGLFESANTVANVKLFYTTGPLTLQGAWNHLSPILFSVSTSDPLQDRRYAASDLFDAQIRLTLSRHITVVAQGKNLSNFRPQRQFGPDFGLLREEVDNGRAFYIGALVRY